MFKKIIVSLLFPFLFIGCEDQKSSPHILKVATSGDNPPFEFYEKGQLTGFDIELMQQVAAKIGKTIEFVDMDFGGIIAALQSGRVDAAIAGLTPTQERRKAVEFSDIYYEALPALITLKSVPYSSVEDLQNKILGVQMGSTHEKAAQKAIEIGRSLTIISLNKIPDLIQDLKAHRVDAILIGSTEAQAIIQADPMLSIQIPRDIPTTDIGNAIAFPKGSLLKEPIDKALKDLESDKSMAALKKKWVLQ